MRVKIARRSVGAILIVEFDLSRKQVDGDYRGMATIDGDVLGIARQCKRTVDGDYRRVAAIDGVVLKIARRTARHAGKSK